MSCTHERIARTDEGVICRLCGARLGDPPAPPPPLYWRATALGAALGLGLAAWSDLARWIIAYLNILVHEAGHAVVALAVGRPALPKFNLQHGGGITPIGERSLLLSLLLLAAGAWLVRLAWPHGMRWRWAAGSLVAGVLLLALTGLDDPAISIAGHLGELLIAGVFLVRALTGVAVAHPTERHLYAAVAGAMLWICISFAWGLASDAALRADYGAPTADGGANDLMRLEEWFGSAQGWAVFLLLFAACVPPGAALVARRWRSAMTG